MKNDKKGGKYSEFEKAYEDIQASDEQFDERPSLIVEQKSLRLVDDFLQSKN